MQFKRTALLGILVALALPASAVAAEQSWGGRHWAEPMNIKVVDYGADVARHPGKWRRTLRAALSEWEASGIVSFRLREARHGAKCEDWDRKAFGEAKRRFPDGQISICKLLGGDPLIAGWTVGPRRRSGAFREAIVAVRSPNTLCHEIGHALGLDHPYDDEDSCLDYGDWRYPSAHDFASLEEIYSPGVN